MKNHCFEINIALLGNVSAGKTTVLNALLGDKFGEVAMKRTTTCANYFRINAKSNSTQQCPITPDSPRSAESTCMEISKDNEDKISKGQSVVEKHFDVEIDDPFIPCRSDTRIVLVDIPGINEAGTDNEYKEYVSNKWTTFDCALIVMDAKQGVNTEEQVFVLNFVKQNLAKKDVPVIVLCNKVDEPDDEEQMELLKEAENEFKKIFQLDNTAEEKKNIAFLRISALHAFVYNSGSRMSMEQFANFDQSFIEKIGRDQLGRKKWSKLSKAEKLKEAFAIVKDKELLEEALHDSNFSTFISTLKGFLGGEEKQRRILENQISLSLQAMSSSPFESGKIMKKVKFCYKNIKRVVELSDIDRQLDELDKSFWSAYNNFENNAFGQIRSNWPKPDVYLIAGAMDEIVSYFEHLAENNLDDKYERVRENSRVLVLRLIYFLAANNSEVKGNEFWINDIDCDSGVSILSPMDWYLIWSSMLLPSSNNVFYTKLGKEKIFLERLQKIAHSLVERRYTNNECPYCYDQMISQECNSCHRRYFTGTITDKCTKCKKCPKCTKIYVEDRSCFYGGYCSYDFAVLDQAKKCDNCNFQHVMFNPEIMNNWFKTKYQEDGKIVPLDPDNYKKYVHVEVPDDLEDPSHFGHVPYKYCQLMDRIDQTLRQRKRK